METIIAATIAGVLGIVGTLLAQRKTSSATEPGLDVAVDVRDLAERFRVSCSEAAMARTVESANESLVAAQELLHRVMARTPEIGDTEDSLRTAVPFLAVERAMVRLLAATIADVMGRQYKVEAVGEGVIAEVQMSLVNALQLLPR